MAQDLGKLENKAVNLDPDGIERKAAAEHERRKRKQYDDSALHSSAGGDVAPTQTRAVRQGKTRVTGNLQDNSN